MVKEAAVIGFGEAGRIFCERLRLSGLKVSIYDIGLGSNKDEINGSAVAKEMGAIICDSAADAVSKATLIISAVTASQCVNAATAAASGIHRNTYYLDVNSTSPIMNWYKTASYHLSRMITHGQCRADEMNASAATLTSQSVDLSVTSGIAQRQQWPATLRLRDAIDQSTDMDASTFSEAVSGSELKLNADRQSL